MKKELIKKPKVYIITTILWILSWTPILIYGIIKMLEDKYYAVLPIFMICFILLLVFSICFMAYKEKHNIQSSNPNPPQVVFVGDYRIGEDTEWKEYEKGLLEGSQLFEKLRETV